MLCVDGFTKAKVDQFREGLTIIRNYAVEYNLKTNVHENCEHGESSQGNKENRSENVFTEINKVPFSSFENPVTEFVYTRYWKRV